MLLLTISIFLLVYIFIGYVMSGIFARISVTKDCTGPLIVYFWPIVLVALYGLFVFSCFYIVFRFFLWISLGCPREFDWFSFLR